MELSGKGDCLTKGECPTMGLSDKGDCLTNVDGGARGSKWWWEAGGGNGGGRGNHNENSLEPSL